MSHDLQLARADTGARNLAIGEPWFLHDELIWAHGQPSDGDYSYPRTMGQPELLQELRLLYAGTPFGGPDKHMVVANGAKQALSAAIYALHKEGANTFWHKIPYWPSFPTLVKLQGLDWGQPARRYRTIETWPNNPSGETPVNTGTEKVRYPASSCDIWDAAYAHPVYGWSGEAPDHKIMVAGAAKMLGLSGLRVGWLVTSDKAVAEAASYYVEVATSGVSVTAQRQVAAALHFARSHPEMAEYSYAQAREQLLANAGTFNRILSHRIAAGTLAGVPYDGTGMFAWFKASEPVKFKTALDAAGVRFVSGEAFGMVEDGWYRVSMGHRHDYTVETLTALEEKLKELDT